MISLDLTCAYYEAVYADFEWDIVNVPLPSMTCNYLSVNHRDGPSTSLHLPVHERGGCQPQLEYRGGVSWDHLAGC
jgi:hypothetical protein